MSYTLPPANIAQLRESLRKAKEARELCRKGQACGYDMAAQDAVIQALEERINLTLQHFGPGRKIDG